MQYEHVEAEFNLIKLLHETHERSINCVYTFTLADMSMSPTNMEAIFSFYYLFIYFFFGTKSFNLLKLRNDISEQKESSEKLLLRFSKAQSYDCDRVQSETEKCASKPEWKNASGIFSCMHYITLN